jgi:hypothetical protein
MRNIRLIIAVVSLPLLGTMASGFVNYRYQTRLFIVDRNPEAYTENASTSHPFLLIASDLSGKAEKQKAFLVSLFNTRSVALRDEAREFSWDIEYKNDSGRQKGILLPRLVQDVSIEGTTYELSLVPRAQENRVVGFEVAVALNKSSGELESGPISPMAAIFDETADGRIFREEIRRRDGVFFIILPGPKVFHVITLNIDLVIGGPI